MSGGYQALRESAAWLDPGARGHIRMSGPDRVRLAHALTTNHIEQMQAGQYCYAFYLNAQGRILADAYVIATAEALLLDTEAACRETVMGHIDRYIIADDVTLEDLSGQIIAIGVEGPQAAGLLGAAGAPVPETGRWLAWGERMVAAISATGAPGYRIFCRAEEKSRVVSLLEAVGAVKATDEDWKIVRLEQARARFGEDFSEAQIPQETQLLHALHFSKGCYLGQEIVERVRSRGHVNRLLTHLAIAAPDAPAPRTKVLAADKEVGEISSAAWSPSMKEVVAFAYLRAEAASGRLALAVDRHPARLTGLKPR